MSLGSRSERVGISIEEADARKATGPLLNELLREERWRFGVVVFGDARSPVARSRTSVRCSRARGPIC